MVHIEAVWRQINLQNDRTIFQTFTICCGLQVLFVTVFQTSVDLLCKKSYKSSSVLAYFDCFQLNHTVECCNINISCLSQIRSEKIALQAMFLYFCCTFCATAVVSLPRLTNFSPCDPLIFRLAPLFRLIACWKTIFFERSWVIFEKGTEKEKSSG